MVKPNDVQLAAIRRVADSRDGLLFLEWLDTNLNMVGLGLENEENEVHLRWKQGASKTLRTLISTMRKAKETIQKRKESNNE